MNVKVFGLGYVGTVTALCLSEIGFNVEGVEDIPEKVESLKKGTLHIVEEGLDELLNKKNVNASFKAYQRVGETTGEDGVYIICVGTPTAANGSVSLSQINSVAEEITQHISDKKQEKALILLRSTVPPGTCQELLKNHFAKLKSVDLDLVYFPEFLREGSAVKDFKNPKLFTLGINKDQKDVQTKWGHLFKRLPGYSNCEWVSYESAEMIKYAQNSYNALRVAFANELGTIANNYHVPLDELNSLMKLHSKNEPDGMYLRPGFSFGGPCLNKEIEGLSWLGRKSAHDLPLINEIIPSNVCHFERYLEVIEKLPEKKVLFCGVTFKEGTDDLRHSFVLKLVEKLLDRPSYAKKKVISILDDELVLGKLKQSIKGGESLSLVRLEELKVEDYDLIIKGPFELPESISQILRDRNITVIDLGFFNNSEGSINLPFNH